MDRLEPAAGIERMYGDKRYEELVRKTLEEILEKQDIKVREPMITYGSRQKRSVDDGYVDQFLYDTEEEGQLRMQAVRYNTNR